MQLRTYPKLVRRTTMVVMSAITTVAIVTATRSGATVTMNAPTALASPTWVA
jgi:hypothetical protein